MWLVCLVALLVVASACGGQDPSGQADGSPSPPSEADFDPEVEVVRVGLPGVYFAQLSHAIAESQGIYEKYGLSTETFVFNGDAEVAQAILAGEVDAGITSGTPVITSVESGTPLIAVGQNLSLSFDMLLTAPDVTSGEDLRGKAVAVSGFGGDSHASVLLALQELGLTSEDVTVIQIGGESDRIAALVGGSVAAAPVSEAREAEMSEQGFNPLVKLRETGSTYARTVHYFPAEFVDLNPQTILAWLAANIEATQIAFEDTQTAAEVWAAQTQLDDIEAAIEYVEGNYPAHENQRCFGMEPGVWERQLAVVTQMNPDLPDDLEPEQFFTTEFLEELEERGFFESVGAPCSP